MISEVTHRRVVVSPGSHLTTTSQGNDPVLNGKVTTTSAAAKNGMAPAGNGVSHNGTKKLRKKKRRKPSAFGSHYGSQRKREFLMLVVFGAVLIVLVGMVVYKIAIARENGNDSSTDGWEPPAVQQKQQQKNLRNPRFGNNPSQQQKGQVSDSWWSVFGLHRYVIPGSMKHIGDKTAKYAELRREFDTAFPEDQDRSRNAVQQLHKRTYHTKPMLEESPGKQIYDIYNCPFEPPIGYPYQWNIMDVLKSWPPDDPSPRTHIYQGMCVFDYQRDYDKAMNYRTLEKPFVIQNDPEVAKTVERWNAPGYMEKLMGDVPHRTEYSINNHFMYWVPPRKHPGRGGGGGNHSNGRGVVQIEKPNNWTAPTQMSRMTYKEWVRHANVTDEFLGPDQPHWYYRLIGCGEQGTCDRDSSEYLFDELTFFQPKSPSLYLSEPGKQKGIHCRFGMKGVIAENHFDGSRNFIVVLGGERRYILSHPNQCERLALLPKGHPSGRHSAVDWSNPDLETYPQFKTAETNEVILQAGDSLYLPTNWFHYIVSLELNFQCNTRSGISTHYMEPIHACGF